MTWLDNQIKDLQEKTSKFKEKINTIKNEVIITWLSQVQFGICSHIQKQNM